MVVTEKFAAGYLGCPWGIPAVVAKVYPGLRTRHRFEYPKPSTLRPDDTERERVWVVSDT